MAADTNIFVFLAVWVTTGERWALPTLQATVQTWPFLPFLRRLFVSGKCAFTRCDPSVPLYTTTEMVPFTIISSSCTLDPATHLPQNKHIRICAHKILQQDQAHGHKLLSGAHTCANIPYACIIIRLHCYNGWHVYLTHNLILHHTITSQALMVGCGKQLADLFKSPGQTK